MFGLCHSYLNLFSFSQFIFLLSSYLDTPVSEALPFFYDPSLHFQLLFHIHVPYQLLKLNISLVESIFKDQLLFTFLVLLRGLLFSWLLGSRSRYYLGFPCSHFSFTRKLLQILSPAYVCPSSSSHFIPWQPLQFWFPCSEPTAVLSTSRLYLICN